MRAHGRGTRAAQLRGAAWLAGLWACASPGVPDPELPAAEIAIHYRTESEARRRAADLLAPGRAVAAAPGAAVAGHKLGLRAHLGDLGRFLSGALAGDDPGRASGRLALLDPRTRALRFVEGARRGAVPLDWSRDRARLLFSQPDPRGGDLQVYEWQRASGALRPVTRGPALHPQACYGAGGRIAVTRVEAGAAEPISRVWVSGPGGRGPFRALSAGPADHSPACAPGGEIAFARELASGASELWLAEEGSDPRRLGPGAQPRFAAGGDWLIYAALRGGAPKLFRMRPGGGGRAVLGRGGLDETWPAPSPDGSHVVYVAAEEPPRRHLYVRRFDGSGDRILFADGDAEFPVW